MKEHILVETLEKAGIQVNTVEADNQQMVALIKRKLLPISVLVNLNSNLEAESIDLMVSTRGSGVTLEKLNRINQAAHYFKVYMVEDGHIIFEYKFGSKHWIPTADMLVATIEDFEKDVLSVLDENTISKMSKDPVVETTPSKVNGQLQ